MILLREYDEERQLDRVWYESSNVFYSECEDSDTAEKVLRVVFKNGATYQYENVDVNDYLMFIAGGIDNSNGKALNQFVKKKQCPYKRIEDSDKEALIAEMNEIKQRRLQEKAKEVETEEKETE